MNTTTDTTGLSRRNLLALMGVGALGATTLATAGPGAWTPARAASRIIPRDEWGFTGWQAGGAPTIDKSAITHFVVHYHGDSGANINGPQAPRNVDAIHKKDPKNAGILYNFIITQKGEIFDARGYDYRSGATLNANAFSIAAQIHIHGSTQPSAAALEALEWLYGHAHGELGSTAALKITGHGEHTSTDCPGGPLGAWVAGRGQQLYAEQVKKLGGGGGGESTAYPGADAFQIGKSHPAVVTLDKALIAKGYAKHHDGDGYQAGSTFTEYTRKNVQDFQKAQGWSGADADGYPGTETWKRLVG